jgi:peptidyl-prolyl cis-trans isomerase A (cyclophilin A)
MRRLIGTKVAAATRGDTPAFGKRRSIAMALLRPRHLQAGHNRPRDGLFAALPTGEKRMASRLWALPCALLLTLGMHTGALAQKVRLSTSLGDIVVQLDRDKAPKSVDNFLAYVKSGHYKGTVFHRVIPTFMIQGGGMDKDMVEKKTNPPIALENKSGLRNARGTIAMARTNDPNSATAQFFINVQDNVFLDPANARDGNGYAVFGKVIDGMDVVDKIRAVPTTSKAGHQNVPVDPVIIKSATVEK